MKHYLFSTCSGLIIGAIITISCTDIDPKMTNDTLKELYETILDRKSNKQEGSYACYLFDKGLDKILKKVGEECSETIIAAKNGDNSETVLEISDLIYHLFVMMVDQGIAVEDVMAELDKRSNKTGNLKQFHQVDKNT